MTKMKSGVHSSDLKIRGRNCAPSIKHAESTEKISPSLIVSYDSVAG